MNSTKGTGKNVFSGGRALALLLVFALLILFARTAAAQPVSSDSPAGYIDSAVLRNQIRFRYDAAFDNPFPDRAEFFYAKCGCFSGGNGPGPPLPDAGLDYQEFSTDIELMMNEWMSGFVELPVRAVNPIVNENQTGLGDIRAGFKTALLQDENSYLTFQLRGYFPTGDGDKGLGTEHVSLEPALLFQNQSDRLALFGEFRSWIPIGGEQANFPSGAPPDPEREFSGTVLRYGVGAGYDIFQGYECQRQPCGCSRSVIARRLTSVVEVVGWSVLDGLKFRTTTPATPADPAGFVFASAANDTIVNLKLGLRWTTPRNTFYVGYGRALSDEVWYEDIVRAEYAFRF